MSQPQIISCSQFSQDAEMPYVKKRKSSTIKRALKRYRATNQAPSRRSTVKSRSVAATSRALVSGYFRSHQAAFPQRYNEVLRDYEQVGYNPAAGSFSICKVLAVNNPYQVNATGFAQPSGFAKLMEIYSKCYVRSAKVTLTVINVTASGTSLIPTASSMHGLSITTLPTPLASASVAVQGGLETHKALGTNPDQITMSLTVDIGKYLTVDDVVDNSQLFTTASAGPGQLVYIQHWVYNNGSAAGVYNCHYVIDYDCIFTDPEVIV